MQHQMKHKIYLICRFAKQQSFFIVFQGKKQRRGAVLFRQGIQIMGGIGGCRGSDCSSLVVAVGEWCHECSGVTNADYRLLP